MMKRLISAVKKYNLRGVLLKGRNDQMATLSGRSGPARFNSKIRTYGSGVSIIVEKEIDFQGIRLDLDRSYGAECIVFRCMKSKVPISNLEIFDNGGLLVGFWGTPKLINCNFDVDCIQCENAHSLPQCKGTKISTISLLLNIDKSDNRNQFMKDLGLPMGDFYEYIKSEIKDVSSQVTIPESHSFCKAILWDSNTWNVGTFRFCVNESLGTIYKWYVCSFSPQGSNLRARKDCYTYVK